MTAVAALGLVMAVAGCGGSGADKQGTAAVTIADFKYAPSTVTVRAGGSVTWRNDDRAQHTATAGEQSPFQFDTGTLRRGQERSVRFDRKGTFTYVCSFHPFMEGKVVVK